MIQNYGQVQPPKVSDASMGSGSFGRVLPRQLSTGSTRGTQTVGYGNTKIDGSRNQITVGNSILLDGNNELITIGNNISLDGNAGQISVTNKDGSQLGLGLIPHTNNEYGFFSLDTSGNLVMKIVLGTLYVYNPSTTKNTVQMGLLPDGTTYGIAGANDGFNVAEGF